jgi:hypothetical protein
MYKGMYPQTDERFGGLGFDTDYGQGEEDMVAAHEAAEDARKKQAESVQAVVSVEQTTDKNPRVWGGAAVSLALGMRD